MQDGIYWGAGRIAGVKVGGVNMLAAEVVASLVARDSIKPVVLREDLVVQFMKAVQLASPAAFDALKPEFRRARVSAVMLADHYIPEVARRLGKGWEDDCISFADVTMGTARLQSILRDIGADWAADAAEHPINATVLLVIPGREQHTLGAMVLAGWLRRRGISVCMRIAPSDAEIAQLLVGRRFDGALISVACEDKLAACKAVVAALKQATSGALRIVVGGSVLERAHDIAQRTGADIATNDIDTALGVLGLNQQAVRVLEPT